MITLIFRKFYCEACEELINAFHTSQDCPEMCPVCYTKTEKSESIKVT